MYNYRIVPNSDNDIYNSVYEYCKYSHEHEIEEILIHCKQDFERLFMLHECTLFHHPVALNSKLFNELADKYYDLLNDFDIYFPSPKTYGPKYSIKTSTKKDEIPYDYKDNQDSRITKFIPQFFGINYTKPDRTNNRGWKPSINDEKIMTEHKKLYDILYSYCYPNRNNMKTKNNKLGNLTKNSIFRFDDNCKSSYRAAFEHIRRGIIYRLSEDTPSKKIKASIYLDRFSSQMRSVSFSIVDQLIKEDLRKMPSLNRDDCYARTCEYIIKRCSDLRHITIKEKGKKDRTIVPINMNIQDCDSVLHYAYIFFTNLPTIDYIEELKHFFSDPVSDINPILSWSESYKNSRDKFIQEHSVQKYDNIEKFIKENFNAIMASVCIDEKFTKSNRINFTKRHKDHMVSFVHLYRRIHQKINEQTISVKVLLDLLHLYTRLTCSDILIPTASMGYNKKTPSKPVKLNTVMKNIKSEWDRIDAGETISTDLYMKNVISETWLSAVMYMALNEITTDLFLKRLDAIQALFYSLIQRVPAIYKRDSIPVDFNKIVHELLP